MRSEFLTDLVVKKMTGEFDWEVRFDLDYYSASLKSRVNVPAGFVTDFASVPRIPIAFWLTGDTAQKAAVVHDFLYQKHMVSKGRADRVFLEAMKVTRIPAWRRWIMYAMVSAFGWTAYASGPDRFKMLNSPKA